VIRTFRNVLVALLLIVAVGAGCVSDCVDSKPAPKSDPHGCCKKDKSQSTAETPECKSPASEVAKSGVQVAPPLAGAILAAITDPPGAVYGFPLPSSEYSPPDLLLLNQVFLI
jgi:hypothetical protein